MKSFPHQLLSLIAACLATTALTVAASAPASSAARIVVGAAA